MSKKHPDGAFKLFHVSHRTTLADVVCTHPTIASSMKSTYRSVGCLANKQEAGKDGKEKVLVERGGGREKTWMESWRHDRLGKQGKQTCKRAYKQTSKLYA